MTKAPKRSIKLEFKGIKPMSFQKKKLTINKSTGMPRTYNEKEIQQYRDDIWKLARKQTGRNWVPLSGALRVTRLWFWFAGKYKVHYTNYPDLDNLEKLLYDILSINGLIFIDDRLICEKNNIGKYWGIEDGIEIHIEEI